MIVMTESSSEDHCFPPVFVPNEAGVVTTSTQLRHFPINVVGSTVQNGNISEILSQTSLATTEIDNTCAMYAAAIPAELAESLPEGTIFQIMPDATILTSLPSTDAICEAVVFQDSSLESGANMSPIESNNSVVSIPNYAIEISEPSINQGLSNTIKFSEGNISDIDLSFLTESDEPVASNEEIQGVDSSPEKQPQLTLPSNVLDVQGQQNIMQNFADVNSGQEDSAANDVASPESSSTVIVDVSKPIQLSQNALIVVDGRKCILQQDPQTGQPFAYPIKEPEKPKRKRGRPRKSCMGDSVSTQSPCAMDCQTATSQDTESVSEEENSKEKGLLEVVTDDGALVRRSLRKRKRTKVLKDYETGNLNQELGSDLEDKIPDSGEDVTCRKRGKVKGPGRPRKYPVSQDALKDGRRPRGRPRQYGVGAEPTQAFLIQTATGQTMVEVPLSVIPNGMSLQDIAQIIANYFNLRNAIATNPEREHEIIQSNTGDYPTMLQSITEFLSKQSDVLPLHVGLNSSLPSDANTSKSTVTETSDLSVLEGSSATEPESSLKSISSNQTQQENCLNDSTSNSELTNIPTSNSEFVNSSQGISLNIQFSGGSQSSIYCVAKGSVTKLADDSPQTVNEKFPENFMADNELGNALPSIAGQNFISASQENEKQLMQMSEHVTSTDKTSSRIEPVCENSEVADTFDFSFTSALELKKSSNILFGHQREKIINEKLPVSGDLMCTSEVKLEDSSVTQLELTHPFVTEGQNVIFDHEYESRNVSRGQAVNCDKVHLATIPCEVEQEQSGSDSSNDNVICTVVDNYVEIDQTNPAEKEELSCESIRDGDTKRMLCEPSLNFSANGDVALNVGDDEPAKSEFKVSTADSVQKSLSSTVGMTVTWPDVTSVLNTGSVKLTDAVSFASSAAATVIPLPGKVLYKIMPKTDVTSSSSSVNLPEKFSCTKCEFTTSYHYEYQQHLSVHPDYTKQCKCCKYICLSEEELIQHFKDRHPRCICNKCNYMAEQPNLIKRHMYRHAEHGCTCNICGKTYKDHYILKMHVKLLHLPAEVLYKCEICNKKFNRKAHKKRHMRTHDPNKPYKCTLCPYRGCEKSDITKHMLVHEAPRHACGLCGKTFRHIKNRELHVKRHTGQRNYRCAVCDFLGYTFTDIRKHIERRHKPGVGCPVVLCDKCGQAFKTQEELKGHQSNKQCENLCIEQNVPTPEVLDSHFENGDVEPVILDVTSTKEEVTEASSENLEEKCIAVAGIAGLPNSQVVMSTSIGEILNSNGPIIISGFEAAESLSGANLTIISSEDETNKQVIVDPGQINDGLLKLFENVGLNSSQNHCDISS